MSSPAAPSGRETVARNTALALATQLTTAFFTAVLTLYLVRALGPGEYGLFALALALALLILQPSDLGLTQSAARFIADHRGDRAAMAEVFSTGLRFKLLTSFLVAGGLFGLAGPIADAYGEPNLVWPLRGVAVAMLGQSIVAYCGTSFISLRKMATNLRVVFSESVVEATATVGLVLLGAGATGAAFGRAIGYWLGAAVALLLIARILGRSAVTLRGPFGGRTRRLVRYAGAMMVVDIAYQALTQIDAMVIGALLGSTAVGLFQAPVRLLTPLVYPGLAIAQAVAPRMSRGSGSPDVTAFQAALRYVLVIQAAIAIPIVIWAEPITSLGLGDEYAESAEVVQALGPFIFIWGFAPVVSLAVNYLGEARRRIPIAIAAVAINLVLDLILVPEIGIVGAAVGTNVALIFYTLGHLWICNNLVDISLRPLAWSALRVAAASLPMSALLLTIGTSEIHLALIVLGGLAGWAVFAGSLLALGEFSRAELAAAKRRLDGALLARRRR